MAIKILLASKEASAILGTGGSIIREIGAHTNAKLHLSNRHEFYPGTQLQELIVRGQSTESVIATVQLVMEKLSAETGRIYCDAREMAEGGCSMKFVVPNIAAKAIIGRGGTNIKYIRESTGMKVHVEEQAIGQPPISEQIVSFFGSLQGMQAALPNLFEQIETNCVGLDWFSNWAYTSHAGADVGIPSWAPPPSGGKGKGKDKGSSYGSKGAPSIGASLSSYGGGKSSYTPTAGGGHVGAYDTAGPAGGGYGVISEADKVDMIAGALKVLPDHIGPQVIQFNVAASVVSILIGRGGIAIKEISSGTDTKIKIREIEGNPEEKVVVITGPAVGVISAYCHCLARANGGGMS